MNVISFRLFFSLSRLKHSLACDTCVLRWRLRRNFFVVKLHSCSHKTLNMCSLSIAKWNVRHLNFELTGKNVHERRKDKKCWTDDKCFDTNIICVCHARRFALVFSHFLFEHFILQFIEFWVAFSLNARIEYILRTLFFAFGQTFVSVNKVDNFINRNYWILLSHSKLFIPLCFNCQVVSPVLMMASTSTETIQRFNLFKCKCQFRFLLRPFSSTGSKVQSRRTH